LAAFGAEAVTALEEALKNKTWEITFGQGGGFVVDPRTGQKVSVGPIYSFLHLNLSAFSAIRKRR
jgi:hypothetical protein